MPNELLMCAGLGPGGFSGVTHAPSRPTHVSLQRCFQKDYISRAVSWCDNFLNNYGLGLVCNTEVSFIIIHCL